VLGARDWFTLIGVLHVGLLAANAADGPVAPAPNSRQIVPASGARAATTAGDRGIRRLPPVVRQTQFIEPVRPGAPSGRRARPSGPMQAPEEIPGLLVSGLPTYPIDLSTALRLADAGNLQVAFAREQVNQALARVDQANALWLPSVRGGTNYNRHEGAIQRVEGTQITNSRGAFYAGLGAGGYGASSPTVPGLYANFSLADAFFQPLAARQFAGSRGQAARAATNDTLLQVTLTYFDLLRGVEDVAISQATHNDMQYLAGVTGAYAETGEGLWADANRSRAELAIRLNDIRRSQEAQRIASARLAQLLRLDPLVILQPADPAIVPIEVIERDVPTKELVVRGLSQRPELAESRLLVEEAVVRLRRERMAILLPSIVMGASYGGMGAGINEQLAPFHDRLDVDAIAFWEMRNFGFGEAAARRGAESTVRANQFKQLALMDQVAREVVEAHTQVLARKDQMATARMGIEAALVSQQQNIERIEQAKGLPIEVLQSIQTLAQARREYLRTVIDYNVAQFTLYRALGWPVQAPALPR
jgi:outer membrane protein TolC